MRHRVGALFSSETALVCGGAVAFGLIFSHPILAHLGVPAVGGDWDLSLQYNWAAVRSIAHYGQFPLWNPWKCGGTPLFANPQSRVLTPFLPLSLVLGSALGLHLEISLHLMVMWAGGYVLGRILKMRPLGAACCATAFPASSWYYLHSAAGHATFFAFAYLPWVMALAFLCVERRRAGWAIGAGALLALCLFEGGAHVVLWSAVTLSAVMAVEAVMRRSPWPLYALALSGLFAFGFGAVKLLPALALYRLHPRPISGAWSDDVGVLLVGLFAHNQDLRRVGLPAGWGFWELGAYVGLFIVPAVFGLFAPRRAASWAVAAGLMFLAARGDFAGWSPWTLLHALPGFHSERLPSRLLILVVFALGVIAGLGVDLFSRVKRPWGAAIGAVLLIVAAVDCFLVGPPNLRYILSPPLAPPSAASPVFHQYRSPHYMWNMLQAAQANQGELTCYDYTDFKTNALGVNQPGYRGEQYLLGPGRVRLLRWTPNSLSIAVAATASTMVVVNQNYDLSWGLARGRGRLQAYRGLLAVRIPAGDQTIELRYLPTTFLLGLATSLFFLMVALLPWGAIRRRRRSESPR